MALAAGLTLGSIVVGSTVGFQWASAAGLLVLGGSLLLIYFNGYLVPGTPELTKRYFPRWLLAAFAKADTVRSVDAFDPDAELRAAGLVIEGTDDVQLQPAFEHAWRTAIDDVGSADMSVEAEITQRLGALGGFGAENLEFVDGRRAFQAWYEDEQVANWESRAACIADIAAADIVPDYDSGWYDRPLAMQAELLGALRLFLEQCPACHGAVTLSRKVVSSCCYDYDVVATTCTSCNARLFEIEVNGDLPADE